METNTGSMTPTQSTESTGTSVEGSENQTQGQEGQPTAAQVQALKKKFQYKIDGEDVEEEVDLSNEEELKKRFQLGHAAKKRMAESAAAQRKAVGLIKAFENDESFTELINRHPKGREIAEKILLAKLQEEMMTPEEKAARQEKSELEQLRKEKAERENKDKLTASQQLEAKYAESYQKTIIEALNKTSLPKTAGTIKRMAAIMKKNLDLGLELTAEDLAQEVRGDLSSDLKSIIADADGDQLIAMFGEDIAKKIRLADLKKLQEKQSQVFQGGQKPKTEGNSTPKEESRPMTMEEWKESVNRRIGLK